MSKLDDVILRDTRANQPAATTVPAGALYYVTDESVTERSSGTAWEDYSDGGGAPGGGGMVLLEQHTAANSASLNFTTGITSTYDDYVLRVVSIVPATSGADLTMRLSTDGGSTWVATGYWKAFSYNGANAGGGSASATTDTSGFLSGNLVNSGDGVCGEINLVDPLNASLTKSWEFRMRSAQAGGPYRYWFLGAGWITGTTPVDAVQIIASSGNLTSGTVRLYGYKK